MLSLRGASPTAPLPLQKAPLGTLGSGSSLHSPGQPLPFPDLEAWVLPAESPLSGPLTSAWTLQTALSLPTGHPHHSHLAGVTPVLQLLSPACPEHARECRALPQVVRLWAEQGGRGCPLWPVTDRRRGFGGYGTVV